jgi:predicted component of type VI protein secretion system
VIQIEILNGTKAGTQWVARRFPFRIGRDPHAALQLADAGVWDSHVELSFQPGKGCFLTARAESLTLINGQPITGPGPVRLRSGDVIEVGSVSFRFGLSPARSAQSGVVEAMVWTSIALLCLGQIALIYLVLP